jgi:aspartate racemase
MKTVGLLGGMGWPSTITYYTLLNEGVAARLGGLHSARCVLWSVDFAEIEACQAEGRWDDAGTLLAGGARTLANAGAELLVLCTNTMHRVSPRIEAATTVPLLHIADATADAIRARGDIRRVGLLGTRYTMEQAFYRGRLESRHGLEVVVPDATGRQAVHDIIYEELVHGVARPTSRETYRQIISALVADGAEALILGCTEIGLLVAPEDAPIPVFDTTRCHAEQAVARALTG